MNRLVIGTKRYSSWSLRGWLAVHLAGLEVSEQVVRLAGGGQTHELRAISPNGLVPYLEHAGARVWESLAICEYCAELAPGLWPLERARRALARSVATQMHGGFAALRQTLPMNEGRVMRPRAEPLSDAVRADIGAVVRIWEECRGAVSGGRFLFGEEMTVPDIMFAPVVSRFHSYGVVLPPVAGAYAEAVRAHPLMRRWRDEAMREPDDWLLAPYETLS